MATLVTKHVRTAAKEVALRTAAQSAEAGLGLVAAGAVIFGASDVLTLDWVGLGSAIGLVALSAIFAGTSAYLSMVAAGVPSEYANAASADATSN